MVHAAGSIWAPDAWHGMQSPCAALAIAAHLATDFPAGDVSAVQVHLDRGALASAAQCSSELQIAGG